MAVRKGFPEGRSHSAHLLRYGSSRTRSGVDLVAILPCQISLRFDPGSAGCRDIWTKWERLTCHYLSDRVLVVGCWSARRLGVQQASLRLRELWKQCPTSELSPDISYICTAWPNILPAGGVDRHKFVLNGPLGPLPDNLASGLASKQNLLASLGHETSCFFSFFIKHDFSVCYQQIGAHP